MKNLSTVNSCQQIYSTQTFPPINYAFSQVCLSSRAVPLVLHPHPVKRSKENFFNNKVKVV